MIVQTHWQEIGVLAVTAAGFAATAAWNPSQPEGCPACTVEFLHNSQRNESPSLKETPKPALQPTRAIP